MGDNPAVNKGGRCEHIEAQEGRTDAGREAGAAAREGTDRGSHSSLRTGLGAGTNSGYIWKDECGCARQKGTGHSCCEEATVLGVPRVSSIKPGRGPEIRSRWGC